MTFTASFIVQQLRRKINAFNPSGNVLNQLIELGEYFTSAFVQSEWDQASIRNQVAPILWPFVLEQVRTLPGMNSPELLQICAQIVHVLLTGQSWSPNPATLKIAGNWLLVQLYLVKKGTPPHSVLVTAEWMNKASEGQLIMFTSSSLPHPMNISLKRSFTSHLEADLEGLLEFSSPLQRREMAPVIVALIRLFKKPFSSPTLMDRLVGGLLKKMIGAKEAKSRYFACLGLLELTKLFPKKVTQYWTLYTNDIFALVVTDDHASVRIAALDAITSFIQGPGKSLLSHAQENPKDELTSFISLSEKIAYFVRASHAWWCSAIIETDNKLIIAQLKFVEALTKSGAFGNLRPGLLGEIADKTIQRFLLNSTTSSNIFNEEEMRISSAALDTLTIIIENSSSETLLCSMLMNVQETDRLWSFFCLSLLPRSSEKLALSLCGFVCSLLRQMNLLMKCCCWPWPQVKSLIDTLIKPLNPVSVMTAGLGILETFAQYSLPEPSVEWWLQCISDYLQVHIIGPHAQLRAVSSDVLSHISANCFNTLPYSCQLYLKTIWLGLADDPDPMVRAAACRCIGIYVSFDPQQSFFLQDSLNAVIKCVNHPAVRIRATWALANICDIIIGEKVEPIQLPDNISIIGLAILTDNNDKIRPNGVRIVASLVVALGVERFSVRWLDEVVISCCRYVNVGSFKLRWNACHALAKMMKVAGFPIGQAKWTNLVYRQLCQALKEPRNFKVRIHAVQALMAPSHTNQYHSVNEDQVVVTAGFGISEGETSWLEHIQRILSSELKRLTLSTPPLKQVVMVKGEEEEGGKSDYQRQYALLINSCLMHLKVLSGLE